MKTLSSLDNVLVWVSGVLTATLPVGTPLSALLSDIPPPPAGAPQRVSGKVSGTVMVGTTPVELGNIDLHAYIVVGDGRAYTAISEVPTPALLPSVNHFKVQWVKSGLSHDFYIGKGFFIADLFFFFFV